MKPHEKKSKADAIVSNIERVIIGKSELVRIALSALLASGHVLLEDVPGTGKTLLAKAMARSLDLTFSRVQFTPDLLPSELVGINFYNQATADFTFRPGALFANIILADEINRATPRTQSGLLESMEEAQVSVDGVTHKLALPYFVIATQNPIETQGTFPLPEAQLDRFMVRMSLGHPTTAEGVTILKNNISELPFEALTPVCDIKEFIELRDAMRNVHIHDDVYEYIVRLAEATRTHEAVQIGVSTRGALALAKLARAYAGICGGEFVRPQEVRMLAPFAFAHRISPKSGAYSGSAVAASVLDEVCESVKVPIERWDSELQD